MGTERPHKFMYTLQYTCADIHKQRIFNADPEHSNSTGTLPVMLTGLGPAVELEGIYVPVTERHCRICMQQEVIYSPAPTAPTPLDPIAHRLHSQLPACGCRTIGGARASFVRQWWM